MTLAKLYNLPFRRFIPAAAMPTHNLNRTRWIFLLALQSKDCKATFADPAHNFFQVNASKTWFGHETINFMDSALVETFFRSQEVCRVCFSLPNYDAVSVIITNPNLVAFLQHLNGYTCPEKTNPVKQTFKPSTRDPTPKCCGSSVECWSGRDMQPCPAASVKIH